MLKVEVRLHFGHLLRRQYQDRLKVPGRHPDLMIERCSGRMARKVLLLLWGMASAAVGERFVWSNPASFAIGTECVAGWGTCSKPMVSPLKGRIKEPAAVHDPIDVQICDPLKRLVQREQGLSLLREGLDREA
jgi:hypothetical protein